MNTEWTPLFTPEEKERFVRNSERRIGIRNTQIYVVKNMKANNVDVDLIAKYVGIPVSEVNEILENNSFDKQTHVV